MNFSTRPPRTDRAAARPRAHPPAPPTLPGSLRPALSASRSWSLPLPLPLTLTLALLLPSTRGLGASEAAAVPPPVAPIPGSASGSTNAAPRLPATDGPEPVAVVSPRGAAGFDFKSFSIVAERNIFNPNRSARGEPARPPRSESEKRVRTDFLSLLGTLSYEKGRFAFFEGSSSDFKKVVQPDERIAGFKVASVAPNCVRLEGANGEKFDLCVGMRMSRREEEAWRVVEAPGEPSGSSPREPGSSGAGSAGGAEDDVIRKMMQRREQEAGGGAANDAGKGSGGGGAEAPASPAATPAEPGPAKASGTSAEADEIVKKLLQKREQELNK